MGKWLVMFVMCLGAVLGGCQTQQKKQEPFSNGFSPDTGLGPFHPTNSTFNSGNGLGAPFPNGFRGF